MLSYTSPRMPWKALLDEAGPLLLPAAHDALTAKIIEKAGFRAYQVGGFAVTGARHGFPDIDLTHYGEQSAAVRDIVTNCALPVMVDADDCYGDVKNVTRVIQGYEYLGASAIFFEDQRSPKKCGHMAGKEVIPAKDMAAKVRAAIAARRDQNTFIIARTDAIAAEGMADALHRGHLYLENGADGLFIEGPTNVAELEMIAKTFHSTPLIANMLEGGGKTPILKPSHLYEMGFQMVTYPTSILFQVAKTIERAAKALLEEKPMSPADGIDMDQFEHIVGLPDWKHLEETLGPDPSLIAKIMQKVQS